MEIQEIISKLEKKEINCEQALESLSELGYCPNLLNDDNGHWAVKFDGFQNVPISEDPKDISTTCFIKAKDWKTSIYEALLWALES